MSSSPNLIAENERLSGLVAAQGDELRVVKNELLRARLRIEKLELEKRRRLIERYGPQSERLSTLQLQLLELEPGVQQAEVEREAGRPAPAAREGRAPAAHPGRRKLPAHLPREEKVIAAPAGQQTCNQCGRATKVIGYEESEQLEVIPARHFVLVVKREKRACPGCRQGVRTAPLPARIIDKSLLVDSAIVEVLVRKYADHCPLYRQSEMMSRDGGVEIDTATLDGVVMRVGETLIPLARAMRRSILAGGYVQADETPVPVQLGREAGRPRKGKHHQAYLWQYGAPGGEAVFDFRMGRGRDGPAAWLKDFEGILQTDGYAAYDRCGRGVLRAACWAHARRGFADALKLHPADRDAEAVLARIGALFAVEAEARDGGRTLADRHALRQQRSRALVAGLREELQKLARTLLPGSATGKAVAYALNLWDRLTLFLDQPRLELSNNLAENSMRPIALGRKNWIHVGHPAAGPRVAAIISVVESCRRLQLPLRQYLERVLPGLALRSHRQLAALTPAAWPASHA